MVTGINRVSKIKHYKRPEFIILKFFVLIEIFVCFSLYVFITKESLGYTFTIIVFILSIPPLIPELIHVHRRKMKHLIEKLKEDNQIESGLHTISLGWAVEMNKENNSKDSKMKKWKFIYQIKLITKLQKSIRTCAN